MASLDFFSTDYPYTKDHIDATLSDKWCEVYEAIRQAWIEFGHGPTLAETARASHCTITTVKLAISKLRERKLATYHKHELRSAKPTSLTTRVLNRTIDPWEELNETKIWAV